MASVLAVLLIVVAAVSALPNDPVLRKLTLGPRFQYIPESDGTPRLEDTWLKASDVNEAARYNPDAQNVHHLFTRENPTTSQVLVQGDEERLTSSNFDASKRVIVIIHGYEDSVTSPVNSVLVPAFLEAEDVNVIVVDWSAGGDTQTYLAAMLNTPHSGRAVARFLAWLNQVSGAELGNYHIIGHGLGGHQAGIVGRNLGGRAAYITALDPSFVGWVTNEEKFTAKDGQYTEVIHTNIGLEGYMATLADVDFYPNGGINMPGCMSQDCDHARSFFYMAESVRTGGFTGNRCATYITAMAGQCFLRGNLQMGGLKPKTGSTGIYHLQTWSFPPFSRG